MRKIYVDDKVRAAADDYAANVFKNRRADFQQPLDLLKKFRDNILSTQDTTQGKVLLAYVDRILAVHSDLLHAEPKQMNMLIHEFNTILQVKGKTEKDKNAQTESLMKTRIQYQKSPKKSETHLFYEWIVEAMRYDDVSSQIIPYLNRINIRTCVYCNAQYAVTARKVGKRSIRYEAFFELDHFYPKSIYPFLCTNFYNLQPSCSSCNKHKEQNPSLFNLYTNDINETLNPFQFSIPHDKVVLEYLKSNTAEALEICFDAPGNNLLRENHEKCFHITPLYSAFKDVTEEIIWKRKAWDKTYMKMMKNQYNGMTITPSLQKRIIFGFLENETDIHLRPLTKLQQDLYNQQDLV